jgi:hypothetical protein
MRYTPIRYTPVRCTPVRYTLVCEVYACICKMPVYEVCAAVDAHLGGTRLGDVRLFRRSLPVNVYEIYGEF